MLEYFCLPVCSKSSSSSRSMPSVSAEEYRYSPWPASSWTFAIRMALRRRLDALVGLDELVEALLGVLVVEAVRAACGAAVVVAVHGALPSLTGHATLYRTFGQ